jgi:hypothetical protein
MKKIVVCFSAFIFSFSLTSKAQTFQRGSLIVSASYGFDIYHLQLHEVNNYYTPPQTVNTTGGAGSGNANLGAEFGVTNWLGLGVQFKLDSYLHSSNVTQANGFEGGLIINAHIVRHLHFDFLAGLNLGASSLTITWNDGYNDQIYGSGSWGDFHITTRIYFGKFGVSATLYFPTINYNLSSNNEIFNTYIADTWKASGEGLNIGVQYHFLR